MASFGGPILRIPMVVPTKDWEDRTHTHTHTLTHTHTHTHTHIVVTDYGKFFLGGGGGTPPPRQLRLFPQKVGRTTGTYIHTNWHAHKHTHTHARTHTGVRLKPWELRGLVPHIFYTRTMPPLLINL